MLNKLISITIIALMLLGLCACADDSDTTKKEPTLTVSDNNSSQDDAEASETESFESNDLLSLSEWQMAYLDYISTRKDNYAFYALVFIDDDNMPELYLCGRDNATGDAVCTLRNGAIVEQRLYQVCGGSYIKKRGQLANQTSSMGVFYTNVYKLNEDGFSQKFSAFSAEVIGKEENGDLKLDYEYYVNDEKVDKADYDDAISDAFNFDKATKLNKDAVEYEEFKKLVENYK